MTIYITMAIKKNIYPLSWEQVIRNLLEYVTENNMETINIIIFILLLTMIVFNKTKKVTSTDLTYFVS